MRRDRRYMSGYIVGLAVAAGAVFASLAMAGVASLLRDALDALFG